MSNPNYLFNVTNKTMAKTKAKTTAASVNSNTLTLYYTLLNTDYLPNGSETIFKTDPEDLETFRGTSSRYMSDSNFNPNTDILTYVSSRTKKKLPDFPKDMYNEIFTITSYPYSENIVQAACNYEDTGSGLATEVNFNNFTIMGACGKFAGYKNIKILYNNDDPQKKRTLIFS